EPLVLIMGFGGRLEGWFFQIRSFQKHYQVVAFDSRGSGKTDTPSEPYDIRTMADDVIGLMDHLGVDKAHILGMSMGGMIAQEIAINYPDRVNKLVLAATHAGMDEGSEVSLQMMEALGLGEDFTEEDLANMDVMKFMSSVVSMSFNRRLYRLILVPLSRRYAKSIGISGLKGQFEAVQAFNTLERLHMIGAPTLVISGTDDRLMPADSSEVIARGIPDAKLVKVEGGSHAFHMEMIGRFNREVLDFLRVN
ncbi:MAG: alpha/beta fold hydrolase, partial [Dehalococcoidia bacterium]